MRACRARCAAKWPRRCFAGSLLPTSLVRVGGHPPRCKTPENHSPASFLTLVRSREGWRAGGGGEERRTQHAPNTTARHTKTRRGPERSCRTERRSAGQNGARGSGAALHSGSPVARSSFAVQTEALVMTHPSLPKKCAQAAARALTHDAHKHAMHTHAHTPRHATPHTMFTE